MSQPDSPNPQQGQKLDQSPVSGQVGQGRDFNQFQDSSGNRIFNPTVNIVHPPHQPQGSHATTKREFQNRRKLLSDVASEVADRLEQSLHNIDPINLHKQKQAQQVQRFWDIDLKTGKFVDKLPSDIKIIDIFDQRSIAGKLLILGTPGSGKTTTLLELAKELIPRAEQDPQFPMPVLFSLSSWQDDRQTIADWLVAELDNRQRRLSVDTGKQWLKDGQLLPLLDGLDELKSEQHERCIQAINQFLQEYRPLHLIVCSRLAEYENCSIKLDLHGAVHLLPLTEEKIQEYLNRVECSQFWQSLQADPNLLKLAKTPLFLNVMTWAYEKISLEKWQKLDSEQSRYRYLFNAYVETMLRKDINQRWYGKGKEPNPEQTQYWLKWLAEKLNQENETEFLIEKMKPDWLENPTHKMHYIIIGGIITGLVAELKGGLVVGLIQGSLRTQLIVSLLSGLILWRGISFRELHEKIKSQKKIKWSWYLRKIIKIAILATICSLIIVASIQVGSYFLKLPTLKIHTNLIYATVMGIPGGIMGGIINSLLTPYIDKYNDTKYPNQETYESTMKAIMTWVIMVIIIILIEFPLTMMPNNIPPFTLASFPVWAAMLAGGLACIQHFTLRIICWANGYSPWNYRRFLGYATERLFLQRVGGRYRFIHKQLQEHFVSLQLSPQTLKQSNILYTKKITIALICIFFVIFTIIVPWIAPGAMPISSNAMTPTIKRNDKLFYGELERSKVYKRGDIIWFYITKEMQHKGTNYGIYFRRIVGLQKEQIEINKGLVYINGKLLSEDYIDKPGTYEHELVQVPADSYFYLGDNRNYSEFDLGGLVPQDHIKGQVIFRYWPPNRMGKID